MQCGEGPSCHPRFFLRPHNHRGVIDKGAGFEARIGGDRTAAFGIAYEVVAGGRGNSVCGIAFDSIVAPHFFFEPGAEVLESGVGVALGHIVGASAACDDAFSPGLGGAPVCEPKFEQHRGKVYEHSECRFGRAVKEVAELSKEDIGVEGVIELSKVAKPIHRVIVESLENVQDKLARFHGIEAR